MPATYTYSGGSSWLVSAYSLSHDHWIKLYLSQAILYRFMAFLLQCHANGHDALSGVHQPDTNCLRCNGVAHLLSIESQHFKSFLSSWSRLEAVHEHVVHCLGIAIPRSSAWGKILIIFSIKINSCVTVNSWITHGGLLSLCPCYGNL